MPKVVTLTSTLTHAGEYGESSVRLSDVVDELHDDNGLSYSRTAEETDLSTFKEWSDEVYYLDSGLKDLLGG